MEILARARPAKVVEVPYELSPRQAGRSKASLRQGLVFLLHLLRLLREVPQVKGRINGLIFVVAGAVITQGADASPLTVIARVFYSPHMQSWLDHGSVCE